MLFAWCFQAKQSSIVYRIDLFVAGLTKFRSRFSCATMPGVLEVLLPMDESASFYHTKSTMHSSVVQFASASDPFFALNFGCSHLVILEEPRWQFKTLLIRFGHDVICARSFLVSPERWELTSCRHLFSDCGYQSWSILHQLFFFKFGNHQMS